MTDVTIQSKYVRKALGTKNAFTFFVFSLMDDDFKEMSSSNLLQQRLH